MLSAKQQALKDMREMGISVNVFVYEKDLIIATKMSIEIEKFDFRHFNKKDVYKPLTE